jgi:hypothetical protein
MMAIFAFAEQKDLNEKFGKNDIFEKDLIKKIQEEFVIR